MSTKFFVMLFLVTLCAGCVDDSYDLSSVNTDNITVGSDDSEFYIPIVTLTLSTEGLTDNTTSTPVATTNTGSSAIVTMRGASGGDTELSFQELLDLVNAFLPSGSTVSISSLVANSAYDGFNTYSEYLANALVTELKESETKRLELAEVLKAYAEDDVIDEATYTSLGLDKSNIKSSSDAQIAEDIETALDEDSVSIETQIATFISADIVGEYLAEYQNVTVDQTDLGDISIDSSISDLLGEDVKITPVITQVDELPFEISINTLKLTDGEGKEVDLINYDENDGISFTDVLDILNNGAQIDCDISLDNYDPSKTGDTMIIKLSLKIEGKLSLNALF